MDCTPRVADLCFRLAVLTSDLNTQLASLAKHLHAEDILVLRNASENIVDRKKDKERHKKRWKIQLKELLNSEIEFESIE